MAKNKVTSSNQGDFLEEPPQKTKSYVDKALKNASHELRKDFMAIFGIFAALLTFTVVQIGVFVQTTRMALLMGAASFFLGGSLTFVLALQYLVSTRKFERQDRVRLLVLALLLGIIFFFSFQCFWYSTHDGDLWG